MNNGFNVITGKTIFQIVTVKKVAGEKYRRIVRLNFRR